MCAPARLDICSCSAGGRTWSSHYGAGGPQSALPIRSAASRPRAGMTWLYVSVVVRICAWPSTSMTTRGCTPSDSSSVAAVCRPSWRRTSRTPASCRRAVHACQSDFRSIGRPLACAKTRSWSFQTGPAVMRSSSCATPVGSQCLDELLRQRQRPAAAVRLRLLVDQALPCDAVQPPPHGQRSVGQVDVRPSQAQGFRLTQTDCQRHRPPGVRRSRRRFAAAT
jgi:hypothetical protein